MTPEQEQLHKANEIIKAIAESRVVNCIPYYDEYLKPKDELFEKFKEFVIWFRDKDLETTGDLDSEKSFKKLKEVFGSRLDGTAGLDELGEAIKKALCEFRSGVQFNLLSDILAVYVDIKSRLQGENEIPQS